MLRLYDPIDQLKPVAPEVWIVDGPAVRFYAMPFSTRMTVVRLPSGDLWLHSPTHPAPKLVAAVRALGPVAHLVSPNWVHYAHLPAWKALFPQATLWASPGVRERAASQGHPIAFDANLGPTAPPDWEGTLRQHIVTGFALHREVVFFHPASRTLILTDLIQNFEPARLPWWLGLIARVGGVADPHGGMPRSMRMGFRAHRAALRAQVDEMIAWAPDRVILSHGRWYQTDGAAELARAFAWLKPPS